MTFTTFILKTIAPIAAAGVAISTFSRLLPRKGLSASLRRGSLAGVVTFGVLVAFAFFWMWYSENLKFTL